MIIMRTKKSYEYTDRSMDIVLDYITIHPQTTNVIKNRLKNEVFRKIAYSTVKRLLERLRENGRVKGYKLGRIYIWTL